MLLNSWSIALLLCSAAAIFSIGMASNTAVRVLCLWDGNSDSEQQIALEGQTWLSAALVQYGLVIQTISLVLLVLAADDFAGMIAGAMCATGSFAANDYGTKTLLIKIAGLFLYGQWIVLHQLDIRSECAPLMRVKFIYLVLLLPLLFLDSFWLFRFLAGLKPDIITSCCGVIFADSNIKGDFLSIALNPLLQLCAFYLFVVILLLIGLLLKKDNSAGVRTRQILQLVYGATWGIFFVVSLIVVTTTFSSYIYAMPTHKCPFDMLQKQYDFIGIPLYLSLFVATFFAVSAMAALPFRNFPGLACPVEVYNRFALSVSFYLLPVFVFIVSYPVVKYFLSGGEN